MPATRVEPSEDVIYQPLQDEVILLNMKDQRYFGLDDVGAEMWSLLVESGDVDLVADRLCEVYEVERPTVRADLDVLVERLMAEGLLKRAIAGSNS